MLKTKVTKIEKCKFRSIDSHLHMRGVVGGVTWDGRNLDSGRSITDCVRIMDECNVQAVVDLDGGFGKNLDLHIKLLKNRYPDRFIIYAGVDWSKINEPDFPEYTANQFEESVMKGAQAIKFFKSLGLGVKLADGSYLRVDSPKLDPLWEKCAELGTPVTMHVADPAAFFTKIDEYNERLLELMNRPNWAYNKPEYYSREELWEQRNNVLEKHPDLIIIGAHVANNAEDLKRVGEWLDRYPNLYVDMSARVGELGRQPYSAREFFIKYADRILFGTDTSGPVAEMYHLHWRFFETDDEYIDLSIFAQGTWKVYGLYLRDDVLEKIYYLNAKKLYKLDY